ncbi:uncharacterized protein BDR25DRAFT_354261 [Lindgomyces ingoldianus]|uniref:Uncharacterized protein n=1 Tax=Lindgomyces ingoldianus TaxID=673940 RepID=A0ACB6QYY5_9PLEO|nr:uncharacterized protein BDR25DRAFT_354261 [Lindgomyces ingoldianus]KAF2471773.1 hypothetical protein BDR25DRAFT_354261 [Lindgomyces ingoldianus]
MDVSARDSRFPEQARRLLGILAESDNQEDQNAPQTPLGNDAEFKLPVPPEPIALTAATTVLPEHGRSDETNQYVGPIPVTASIPNILGVFVLYPLGNFSMRSQAQRTFWIIYQSMRSVMLLARIWTLGDVHLLRDSHNAKLSHHVFLSLVRRIGLRAVVSFSFHCYRYLRHRTSFAARPELVDLDEMPELRYDSVQCSALGLLNRAVCVALNYNGTVDRRHLKICRNNGRRGLQSEITFACIGGVKQLYHSNEAMVIMKKYRPKRCKRH